MNTMQTSDAYTELEQAVFSALENYSNVHRGSGHKSMVSTFLFEKAREIVLQYLELNRGKYVVIFCTPRRAAAFTAQLVPGSFKSVSSSDIGLPLGVIAVAVKRNYLPEGVAFQTGGGTARLVSHQWVIMARVPDRFEAGTPPIINIIAFARALGMVRRSGNTIFSNPTSGGLSAAELIYHDEFDKYSGQELLDVLRQTIIGHNISVPTTEGARPYINLDNSASTPTFKPVWNVVCAAWRLSGDVHKYIADEVRNVCSAALGAPSDLYDVIFTCNTTEAINLAAESLGREYDGTTEMVVLNTLIEHSSNDLPWRSVEGTSLIRLPADRQGFIDLKAMESILIEYNLESRHKNKRIKLVAVSGASNVLGVYNNLAEISTIVHRYGARLLVDAAQMVAHHKVEMEPLGIDYLAFSAHKVYAPFGCGVLVVKKELLKFSPAEMDLIRSSGEENVGGIAALGKVLVLLQRIGMDIIWKEEQSLTSLVLSELSHIPGIIVYGVKDPSSQEFSEKGGVIVFTLKNNMADKVANYLAQRGGIGVRYGCHCAHILVKYLVGVGPALERFQWLIVSLIPALNLPGVVRISFGIGNKKEDVYSLIQILGQISGRRGPHAPSENGVSQTLHSDIKKQMKAFVVAAAERVFV
jgi:selenocysteine lyase/cysteine desulfurase